VEHPLPTLQIIQYPEISPAKTKTGPPTSRSPPVASGSQLAVQSHNDITSTTSLGVEVLFLQVMHRPETRPIRGPSWHLTTMKTNFDWASLDDLSSRQTKSSFVSSTERGMCQPLST